VLITLSLNKLLSVNQLVQLLPQYLLDEVIIIRITLLLFRLRIDLIIWLHIESRGLRLVAFSELWVVLIEQNRVWVELFLLKYRLLTYLLHSLLLHYLQLLHHLLTHFYTHPISIPFPLLILIVEMLLVVHLIVLNEDIRVLDLPLLEV
jgi:hypothetical protein